MGRMAYESSPGNCKVCHGDENNAPPAAGYAGPALGPSKTEYSRKGSQVIFDLAGYTESFMPAPGGACNAQCAADIAAYIATWTTAVASGKQYYELQCDGCHPLGPRRYDPDSSYRHSKLGDFPNLQAYIEKTMPPNGKAHECDAKCSSDIVEYVRDLRK